MSRSYRGGERGYGKRAVVDMARRRAETALDEALDDWTARGGQARAERILDAASELGASGGFDGLYLD